MKCLCGCGGDAGVYKSSNSYLGIKKGDQSSYCRGHNRKTRPPRDMTGKNPLCACGCQKPVGRYVRDRKSHGYIKGDFTKFIVGHAARKSKVVCTIEWRGYTSACWIWQMAKEIHGYGIKHGKYGEGLAHKVYWQAINGRVPAGLDLDHLCGNKSCIRPDHLEAVTRSENMKRAFSRRREARVQSSKGN